MNREIIHKFKEYEETNSIEIRNFLVTNHLNLVKAVALNFNAITPPYVSFDEIFSHGAMGLIDAVGKFKLDKGIEFKTYAIPRIRGSILDNLRELDHISRCDRKRIKLYEEYINKKEKIPTKKEVLKEFKLKEHSYRRLFHALSYSKILGIDHYVDINAENPQKLMDIIRDYRYNPEAEVMENSFKNFLISAVKKLPEREQLVINKTMFQNSRFRELGKILKVTDSRISQLKQAGLKRLRHILKENGIQIYLKI